MSAPFTCTSVLNALSRRIGRDNGISAADLTREITGAGDYCEAAAERLLRSCISELRSSGIAIVGTPGTGYYIASNAEELDECCRFLRSRAMHSLMLESKLRKLPLPDLIGQIKLPT